MTTWTHALSTLPVLKKDNYYSYVVVFPTKTSTGREIDYRSPEARRLFAGLLNPNRKGIADRPNRFTVIHDVQMMRCCVPVVDREPLLSPRPRVAGGEADGAPAPLALAQQARGVASYRQWASSTEKVAATCLIVSYEVVQSVKIANFVNKTDKWLRESWGFEEADRVSILRCVVHFNAWFLDATRIPYRTSTTTADLRAMERELFEYHTGAVLATFEELVDRIGPDRARVFRRLYDDAEELDGAGRRWIQIVGEDELFERQALRWERERFSASRNARGYRLTDDELGRLDRFHGQYERFGVDPAGFGADPAKRYFALQSAVQLEIARRDAGGAARAALADAPIGDRRAAGLATIAGGSAHKDATGPPSRAEVVERCLQIADREGVSWAEQEYDASVMDVERERLRDFEQWLASNEEGHALLGRAYPSLNMTIDEAANEGALSERLKNSSLDCFSGCSGDCEPPLVLSKCITRKGYEMKVRFLSNMVANKMETESGLAMVDAYGFEFCCFVCEVYMEASIDTNYYETSIDRVILPCYEFLKGSRPNLTDPERAALRLILNPKGCRQCGRVDAVCIRFKDLKAEYVFCDRACLEFYKRDHCFRQLPSGRGRCAGVYVDKRGKQKPAAARWSPPACCECGATMPCPPRSLRSPYDFMA